MELGGNIELIGFSGQDVNDLVVVKKIVGNYTKHLTERVSGFERLIIVVKEVHRSQGGEVFELHGRVLFDGGEVDATQADHNLYFGIDALLKALYEQLMKRKVRA